MMLFPVAYLKWKNCYFTLLLAGLIFIFANPAHAQSNCESSVSGSAFLETSTLKGRILNNGALFWPYYPNGSYFIPKKQGFALSSGVFFVAGMINNEIRYTDFPDTGAYGFQPGPLDQNGQPTINCTSFDKVWKIDKQDLIGYVDRGVVTTDIAQWPWQFGAPVTDGDGNPANYDLAAGDLPELTGDQRLWWIMNDRLDPQDRSWIKPIGLEVRGSVHAFDHPGPIGKVSFYHYQMVLKNDKPLEDAYVGFTVWADLGFFDDNYAGSDSLLHLAYAYNADNFDEGEFAYGLSPPAIGVTFFETIDIPPDGLDNNRNGLIDEAGEKLGLSSVTHGTSGRDPGNPTALYYAMQGKWKDGSSMFEGFTGHTYSFPKDFPRKRTKFLFPGDPVTRSFWSAMNLDGNGQVSPTEYGGSTALFLSSGPFSMAPFDTVDVKFAIVWSRGKDHLDSVTQLKKDVVHVRGDQAFFFSPTKIESTPKPPANYILGFKQNYPNPFSSSTKLNYSLPQAMQVRLAVYDILGREVELLVDAQQDAGIYTLDFEAGTLPAGIYLARIELDHLRFTKRMVLVR